MLSNICFPSQFGIIIIAVVAKKPGKEEKKDVLVVGQDDLCVLLWWDIKVAQVVFGPKIFIQSLESNI